VFGRPFVFENVTLSAYLAAEPKIILTFCSLYDTKCLIDDTTRNA
jgi:hypothetical protein